MHSEIEREIEREREREREKERGMASSLLSAVSFFAFGCFWDLLGMYP